MTNQVVTLGYLKTFVNGILSVNSGTYDDTYCPTYQQLTNGTFCTYYKANANPTLTTNGIQIPQCSVDTGYTSTQLVIRKDLVLLYQQLQGVTVSANPTTISCCGGSSTLSTTAHFKLVTKNEDATTTATTQTNAVVTASYSDSASYTTINGSKITFSKNAVNYPTATSAAARTAKVTGSYTYSGSTKTNTVNITQSANTVGSWTWIKDTTTSISVSPSSMSFPTTGGSKSYSVTRYYDSYYEKYDSCSTVMDDRTDNNSAAVTPTNYTSNNASVTVDNSTVTAAENTSSSDLSATVTIYYGGFSDTISVGVDATCSMDWDYSDATLTFSAGNMGACDTEATISNVTITNVLRTNTDCSTEYITETPSSSNYSVTYSPSGVHTGSTSSRNVTVTLTTNSSYGSMSKSVTVSQAGQSGSCDGDSGGGSDTGTTGTSSCMTISYTLTNGAAGTVYFKTSNGTQQATHSVDATGNQQLCNVAEDTVLYVTHSDTAVTVGGDTSFTFKNGGTASISLTKESSGSGGGSTDTYEISASGVTVSANDNSATFYVKSLKNSSAYSSFTFSESCDWVSNFSIGTNTNGTYTVSVDIDQYAGTSDRSCSVTVTQTGGESDTFTIKQTAPSGGITPSTPICNVPMGTFAGTNDFRVDFASAVTSDVTVSVTVKDTNCNTAGSFDIIVSSGKKTGYEYDSQEVVDAAAAYFEITDVSPTGDTTYIYWGGDCEYDDSGDCSSTKTPITVTFTGSGTKQWIDDLGGDMGCDNDGDGTAELYLPPYQWTTPLEVSYKISGVSSVPSGLKITVESLRYHLGKEHTGSTSFTPTSLSGVLIAPDCTEQTADNICIQVEQTCSIEYYDASCSNDAYVLTVVDNVTINEENIGDGSDTVDCVNSTVILSATSESYSMESYREVQEVCDDNPYISIVRQVDFIGSSTEGHNVPVYGSFSITNIGATIESVSSSNMETFDVKDLTTGSMGFDFTITPKLSDAFSGGGDLTISGTYTYQMSDGTINKNGTFSIQFNFYG